MGWVITTTTWVTDGRPMGHRYQVKGDAWASDGPTLHTHEYIVCDPRVKHTWYTPWATFI